jgi:hypothetical protein
MQNVYFILSGTSVVPASGAMGKGPFGWMKSRAKAQESEQVNRKPKLPSLDYALPLASSMADMELTAFTIMSPTMFSPLSPNLPRTPSW